ncbi:MAG: thioredoxin-like domain-containing protein [Flavitalea sp.]
MKQLFIFSICVLATLHLFSQKGYDIAVNLKPFKNAYVYLGYYYGKVKALSDSAMLDSNSTGHLKGDSTLKGGIYFVVSPNKQILFEMLIDSDQHFTVEADTSNLPASVKFNGSAENELFQQYSAFAGKTGKLIGEVSLLYAQAKSKKDSLLVAFESKKLGDQLQRYRDSISAVHPDLFLTTLFKAMNEPKIPSAKQQPGGKYDSNYVYHFFKSHYWDGISMNDDRLVRTPFFEPRLLKYYDNLIAPNADSIIKETDAMLLESRTAKDMYQFLMVTFVQKYINPTYMGQDAVFVHLFEKYINTGKAEFFTPQYKEFATKRAYSLMANLIGQPAPALDMVDTANKPLPLYSIAGQFTVICFWDPTCSHCKEIVPKVDSIYEAKWKKLGVQIYGVKVDGTQAEWVKFIGEHHLKGWKHVYQPSYKQEQETKANKPSYKQLYDVYQTPLLYLLDKQKRIIAKKLSYLQIDEVINAKIQTTK